MKSKAIMGIVSTALLIGMLASAFEIDVATAAAPRFVDSGQSLGSAYSSGVALGDLDGDGDLDAYVANCFDEANKVWVNNGDGTFTAGQGLGSASSYGVALGDLDGDGDLDAYVANGYAENNRVWVNNGTGTFTAGQGLGSMYSSSDVALGDLDGDGDLDAYVANGGANWVLRNDGTGTFTTSQSLGSATSMSVALGDLDDDGDLDAYVANSQGYYGEANRVWVNNGAGTFSGGQSLGSATSKDVALGDLDDDGDLDAYVANWGANKVWLNCSVYVWSMFRHDLSSSGYSASTAPNTNNTIWTYTTDDEVYSSPAFECGKVYVGSNDFKVYCLNALTGAKIWDYTTDDEVYSSPAVAGGKVYVGSNDFKVYCLNALTGAKIWDYTTGGRVESSPAVAGGKVYVGSNDFKVYCLNALTGAHLWNYTTEYPVGSSPAVADGKVYVGSYDDKVYCLDASTGAHIWNYTTGGYVYSSPAVADGKVYVGSYDDKVYCLDASTGAHIWNYTTGNWVWSSPAVADGKVYVGSYDFKVYCLNALTGVHVWNYTTEYPVISSPAVADGKVYVGSGYKVYCLNASDGVPIWSYTTDNGVYSCPAVAGGKVFVGSRDGKVYAFARAPVANAGGPYSGYEGSSITFNAGSSTDDGTIVLYEWDWNNDGTYDEKTVLPIINHAWGDDFTGTVGLRVKDDAGLTDTGTTSVTVQNVAPTVNAGSDQNVTAGTVVSFSGSFTDPGSSDTHTNFWDFGDDTNATGTLTPTHVYEVNGSYTVTLRVSDDDSGVGTDTLKITVGPLTPPVPDVAVVNVTTSKTGCLPMPTVAQGYNATVNATVENQGEVTETFNATVYANTTLIGTQTNVVLASGDSTTLTFTWDTTSFAYGNYTISANITILQDETDIDDNTCTDGVVLVSIPGDVDGDRDVDVGDQRKVQLAMFTTPGDPNWNPNMDIDCDLDVDVGDQRKQQLYMFESW